MGQEAEKIHKNCVHWMDREDLEGMKIVSWIGARWWKFDFHCHTPASNDYGKGPSEKELKRISAEDWLLHYMRAKIDCIAITDHNTGGWIDLLQHALLSLSAVKHPDYRPLYLFPGVEISASDGTHVLAILGMDKQTSDIDTLLGAVGFTGIKGECKQSARLSAAEVVNTVAVLGGIAIPAHVDQVSGLFVHSRASTQKQVFEQDGVIAAEFVDSSFKPPRLYQDLKLDWTSVLGSDAHHPTGFGEQRFPGSHFTWVKMSEPSLEGLRLALLDGALSVRRSDSLKGDPDLSANAVIERIIVEDAKYLGRGESFECRFNPWLNSIIGGRGTGKSTILELIRSALERDDEIPENLEKEYAKYNEVSVNRQDSGLLTSSTAVTILYKKDKAQFKIMWSAGGKREAFVREQALGVWRPTPGAISQRFPIRIYSQKQIFELASHPNSLLKVIDDSAEVDLKGWETIWNDLLTEYLSLKAQERAVASGLQKEDEVKGVLDDVRRKLAVFDKSGYETVLKNYHKRENQRGILANWERTWSGWANQLSELAVGLSIEPLEFGEFTPAIEEHEELNDLVQEIETDLLSTVPELSIIADKFLEVHAKWHRLSSELLLNKNIIAADEEYQRLIKDLEDEQVEDPSEYSVLVDKEQELLAELSKFEERKRYLQQLKMSSQDYLRRLTEHRQKLTTMRAEFVNKILADNTYVQIEVIPFGDKANIESEIRRLIDREKSFQLDVDQLIGYFTEASHTSLLQIEKLKKTITGIYHDAEGIAGTLRDARFGTHIRNLEPEQLDRMWCWFPEDALRVSFSLKAGGEFTPIDQGSPGQKTVALLAFILSYGDEPLILDQPEDDLNNELIYSLIVRQLRETKCCRQVIVVTHNANIVVNGDSENTIVLDARRGQSRIISQGGLQEPKIRYQICKLLEGGRDAFEERYRRINVDGTDGWTIAARQAGTVRLVDDV